MPRIELTDALSIGILDSESYLKYAIINNDPGQLGPFDLCLACYLHFDPEGQPEHPPYEDCIDTEYRCGWCDCKLTESDD